MSMLDDYLAVLGARKVSPAATRAAARAAREPRKSPAAAQRRTGAARVRREGPGAAREQRTGDEKMTRRERKREEEKQQCKAEGQNNLFTLLLASVISLSA